MNKRNLIFLVLTLTFMTSKGQSEFYGNYYGFDKIVKSDSVQNVLKYLCIGKEGEVWFAEFPVEMITAEWARKDEEKFSILRSKMPQFGKGLIEKRDNEYYCNLKLCLKSEFNENIRNEYFKEIEMKLFIDDKKNLIFDSLKFKQDSTGRIFKRFSGY